MAASINSRSFLVGVLRALLFVVYIRRTPHPVIVTIRGKKDSLRVLFYSYYTTITGWVALLTSTLEPRILGRPDQVMGMLRPVESDLNVSLDELEMI